MHCQELPLRRLAEATYVVIYIFLSQFSCCPLVWMFYRYAKNNKNNKTKLFHEICLSINSSDKKSIFIKFY